MSIYTHPVLRNDTKDVKGNADLKVRLSKSKTIKITPVVDEYFIGAMLHTGKASIQLLLENKKCFFSKQILIQMDEYTLELDPENDPSGTYNVQAYIRSNENKFKYSSESFHSDYGKTEFIINKGSILSYLGNFSFDYVKDFQTPQEKDSIFELKMDDNYEMGAFKVDYLGDMIVIMMHTNDHNKYFKTLNAIDKSVLINIYILPALIQSIIHYQSDEYENAQWAKTISDVMNDKDLDWKDPVYAAQRILADPVNLITESLKKLTSYGFDDE